MWQRISTYTDNQITTTIIYNHTLQTKRNSETKKQTKQLVQHMIKKNIRKTDKMVKINKLSPAQYHVLWQLK
jgi:CTP synthase (UTP-ammonia lyase)